MDQSELSKEELLNLVLELKAELERKDEEIQELKARLRRYENPHTPPSKRRSATRRSPTSQDDDDDDEVRTDGGTN